MPSTQHVAPEDDEEDEDEDEVATGVSDDKAEAITNAVECLQLLLFNRAQLTQSRAVRFTQCDTAVSHLRVLIGWICEDADGSCVRGTVAFYGACVG